MDLLDIARGPALWFALAVFALGTLWRLAGVLRLPRRLDRSPPRAGAPGAATAAARAVLSGLVPRRGFAPATRIASFNGYVFHVGLALVVFGYAPHIAFVQRLTGLSWPALPDAVMYLAAAVTIVSLLMALWLRLGDPVLRLISGPDDWISWSVTFLPLVTGMAVATDPSAALLARDAVLYRTPLAVHLLTLELLLVWFPFGKLMHAVLFAFSRGATGMRFAHRGVKV
jgi:nitrate reductase gamma subunit